MKIKGGELRKYFEGRKLEGAEIKGRLKIYVLLEINILIVTRNIINALIFNNNDIVLPCVCGVTLLHWFYSVLFLRAIFI